MTATAFHNISIVFLIIGGAGIFLCFIADSFLHSGVIRKIMMLLGAVAFVFGITFGILGLISYASYKSYSASSEYAEYIPEQMSYWDWLLTDQWVVKEIECPNCGTEVSIDYTYCPECNYSLKEGYICPECGGKIQPTDIYCPWCGTDL